ncbi:MAG: pyridoxal-phosphate dependent enzyme, partial [Rhodospirillales bacterium]|nr:pyridoxal-phosphate dependent enzyme [Rhodospirillales bacterium]
MPALAAGVAGISRDEIVAASEVIAGRARVTPLLESGVLNARTGGRVLIKPECLQRTGSFKFRGAYNRIAAIPIERRTAGIVAWSSGNHAQGVACAARLFGSPATIVMPNDAARIKVAGVKNFGAEIVFYDRRAEGREELGNRVLQERG